MTLRNTTRLWVICLSLPLGLLLAACGGEDASSSAAADPDASSVDTSLEDASSAPDTVTDTVETPDTVTEDVGPSCPPVDGQRPSRRSEHAGIYDPVDDRIIFYGGSFAIPENCSFAVAHTFETEIWSYDVACDHWREVTGAGLGPAGRNRHVTTYDSKRHQMVLFGGRYRAGTSGSYTLYDDVWAFDLATETWAEVTTSGIGPSARVNGSMVYDSTMDRLILFGGNQEPSGMSYDSLNDLWELDLTTGAWKVLQTTGPTPSPRLLTTAVWDDARQWFVLFGGADNDAFFNTATYFNDLFTLDFSGAVPGWQSMNAPGAAVPDGRFWSSMIHDKARDRYIVFGGHDALSMGNRNDLWAFYPESWAWQELDQADTWNKDANGFCDFPPDFTNVDFEAPERRNAAVFVAGADSAWLTGGKTDCGAIDDLMRLDLESATWEDVTTATVGVSCLRKGGLNCNDLCF